MRNNEEFVEKFLFNQENSLYNKVEAFLHRFNNNFFSTFLFLFCLLYSKSIFKEFRSIRTSTFLIINFY